MGTTHVRVSLTTVLFRYSARDIICYFYLLVADNRNAFARGEMYQVLTPGGRCVIYILYEPQGGDVLL